MHQFFSHHHLFDIIIAVVLGALIIWSVFKLALGQGDASDVAQQLYVGNLPYRVTDSHLQDFFGQFGQIKQLRVITNRHTGRSKGFGFVTYAKASQAEKALSAHGEDFRGRTLVVRQAKPKGE